MERRFLYGLILGLSVSLLFVPFEFSDASIPPTSAVAKINVMTSPWFGSDTNVNATSSSQQIYYVSDGSITFNVTSISP